MSAQQLALTLDPRESIDPHAWASDVVADAIRDCAARCRGVVHQNDVRAALADVDLPRGIEGRVYRSLRCAGRLVADGWDISDDVKGGNNGKPARRYRWVTA